MDPLETFTVSRARPTDAEAIADFVTRSTRGRISVVPESVVERSGTKGLWLVSDTNQQIVGLAGWRAENLIARSILLVPLRASQRVVNFYENCGYLRAEAEELPRVWQETAQEATKQNRCLMLKQLREDLVTRPM